MTTPDASVKVEIVLEQLFMALTKLAMEKGGYHYGTARYIAVELVRGVVPGVAETPRAVLMNLIIQVMGPHLAEARALARTGDPHAAEDAYQAAAEQIACGSNILWDILGGELESRHNVGHSGPCAWNER